MALKRITDKHPFMQKINALYEYMDTHGIAIEYGGAGGLTLVDTQNDQSFWLRDADTGEAEPVFPSGVEFKLTFEDDE
jgi:hypothetical protein